MPLNYFLVPYWKQNSFKGLKKVFIHLNEGNSQKKPFNFFSLVTHILPYTNFTQFWVSSPVKSVKIIPNPRCIGHILWQCPTCNPTHSKQIRRSDGCRNGIAVSHVFFATALRYILGKFNYNFRTWIFWGYFGGHFSYNHHYLGWPTGGLIAIN